MLNESTFRFSTFHSEINAAFRASVYVHMHMSVRNVRTCVLRNVCQDFLLSTVCIECVICLGEYHIQGRLHNVLLRRHSRPLTVLRG